MSKKSIKSLKISLLLKLRKYLGVFHVLLWNNGFFHGLIKPHVFEARNAKLKNIHQGKRAFIIGNGPSILKQDLTKLKGEIIFVMNDFFLHPQFQQISPTYLCSCDPGFTNIEFRKAWYKLHMKVNTLKTTMLFNKSTEKIDKKYHFFQSHRVYYLRPASMFMPPLWEIDYCPIDITLPLSGHHLAFIYIGLFSAAYMGIKKIYLLGMDWGEIKTLDDYINYDFYGKHPLLSLDEYRKDYQFFYKDKSYRQSRRGYHEKTIACIKRSFKRLGIKIYNTTYNKGNFTGFDYVNF